VGSFRTHRSVPMFLVEFVYSVLVPGYFFTTAVLRFLKH
jgi:hypothetical protein